jgi:hypothetical protein
LRFGRKGNRDDAWASIVFQTGERRGMEEEEEKESIGGGEQKVRGFRG